MFVANFKFCFYFILVFCMVAMYYLFYMRFEMIGQKDLIARIKTKMNMKDLFGDFEEKAQPTTEIIYTTTTTEIISSDMVAQRPYYFARGEQWATPEIIPSEIGERTAKIFPYEDPFNDRIINQLMYMPQNYDDILKSEKFKVIHAPEQSFWNTWKLEPGMTSFENCPVFTCSLKREKEVAATADLVISSDCGEAISIGRPPNQLHMFLNLESPTNAKDVKCNSDSFNWTMTFRHDSTIPIPDKKWAYYDPEVQRLESATNFASRKTTKVAWIASTCATSNDRISYVKELSEHIEVDIFGECGNKTCPHNEASECFDMFKRDYKFYLSFEDSNCKDYITSPFFKALDADVLPIVMGAQPADYKRIAPIGSFIHVNYFSGPKELAEYLHELDQDDELYNEYFRWRGTGEFVDSNPWCRLCALLHDGSILKVPHWYEDLNAWWLGNGACTEGTWRDASDDS